MCIDYDERARILAHLQILTDSRQSMETDHKEIRDERVQHFRTECTKRFEFLETCRKEKKEKLEEEYEQAKAYLLTQYENALGDIYDSYATLAEKLDCKSKIAIEDAESIFSAQKNRILERLWPYWQDGKIYVQNAIDCVTANVTLRYGQICGKRKYYQAIRGCT